MNHPGGSAAPPGVLSARRAGLPDNTTLPLKYCLREEAALRFLPAAEAARSRPERPPPAGRTAARRIESRSFSRDALQSGLSCRFAEKAAFPSARREKSFPGRSRGKWPPHRGGHFPRAVGLLFLCGNLPGYISAKLPFADLPLLRKDQIVQVPRSIPQHWFFLL